METESLKNQFRSLNNIKHILSLHTMPYVGHRIRCYCWRTRIEGFGVRMESQTANIVLSVLLLRLVLITFPKPNMVVVMSGFANLNWIFMKIGIGCGKLIWFTWLSIIGNLNCQIIDEEKVEGNSTSVDMETNENQLIKSLHTQSISIKKFWAFMVVHDPDRPRTVFHGCLHFMSVF